VTGAALEDLVALGVSQLGGLDVVVANAGISNWKPVSGRCPERQWQQMIDVNLTG